jgi:hypothetical protein
VKSAKILIANARQGKQKFYLVPKKERGKALNIVANMALSYVS